MKGGVIALIVVLVIIGIGMGAFFVLTGSSETVAYLNIEGGKVQVDKGAGWEQAADQMELKKDFAVKTLDDGQASIVFYESDIMELQPNTEVKLAELVASHVAVSQKSGETWNRVSKLTGTREYTVETPNSVATVRGTGFGVNVSEGSDEIIVDEGTVQCSLPDKKDFKDITEYRSCMVKNGQIKEGEITKEQLIFIRQRIEKEILILKMMQLRELWKNKILVNAMKERYNLTNEDLKQFIEETNSGRRDLNELRAKIPVRLQSLDKIIKIAEKIAELNKRLQMIDQKIASM